MKATWYDRQGKAPEVIQYGNLPTPEPAADEVLVQIHASAVNPSDTKKRSGWGGMGMGFDLLTNSKKVVRRSAKSSFPSSLESIQKSDFF
jgi:NADPH:quinone reductase-like Zn-dependent oxidoreductase